MKSKQLPPLPEKKGESSFKIGGASKLPTFTNESPESTNIRYPLISPYATAHLYWDNNTKEIIYEVEEPKLTEQEDKTLRVLEDGISELINVSYLSVNKGEKVIEYLEKNVKVLLSELRITLEKESFLRIMYFIYRDFVGLGKIEPLLNDYFIEDIECNGINSPIYVVHRKFRNIKTNLTYTNVKELANFVERLSQKSGQYVSYANPILDGILPDGSRVNATYTEDISTKGPTFTIRKFTKRPWTPTQLMYLKTISPEILAYLWLLVEYERNIMILGGTASGKTTMLNCISFFIPPQARVVSIEDTRELNLEHENWLPSVAREGIGLTNLVGQKYGEVSLFNLLKESFRQNPDYVIVGEVRGNEAYVLFQGMASGHPSLGTMHANSVDTMVKRLETPPINLSPSLVETLDAVIVMTQSKREGKPIRRVREIEEIVDITESKSNTNVPFMWDPEHDTFILKSDSYVFKKLVLHHGISKEKITKEFELRTKLLKAMYKSRIFGFHDFRQIINVYYKDPKSILRRFGIL